MSAPVLTPTESAIFDEDVLTEIEERLDEPIDCVVDDCGREAAWRVSLRCCGDSAFFCHGHYFLTRARMELQLMGAATAHCVTCGHVFVRPLSYDLIARVVPL
jgi:hypothetical protein